MDYQYISDIISISSGCFVRVYKNKKIMAEHSTQVLVADPLKYYINQIWQSQKKVGIVTNSLFQNIGYIFLNKAVVITIGPTLPIITNSQEVDKELALIGIKEELKQEFKEYIFALPNYTIKEIANKLALISYLALKEKISTESILDKSNCVDMASFYQEQTTEQTKNAYDDAKAYDVTQNYNFGKKILSMIRFGQIENIKEVLSIYPSIKVGILSKDEIRQRKNIFICTAALASRAAIEGGLDCVSALQASDFFIQRAESLYSEAAINHLLIEMVCCYTEKVSTLDIKKEEQTTIIKKVIQYISKHITEPIKVYQIAIELNIDRAYLSTLFKKAHGINLSNYINKQKIKEAKRLLIYSDSSIIDISNYLYFSSQSHFQNLFKKEEGITPSTFRKQNKII